MPWPPEGIYNAIPFARASDVRAGLNPQAAGAGWKLSKNGKTLLDQLRAQMAQRGALQGETGALGIPERFLPSTQGVMQPSVGRSLVPFEAAAPAPGIGNIGSGGVPSLGYSMPTPATAQPALGVGESTVNMLRGSFPPPSNSLGPIAPTAGEAGLAQIAGRTYGIGGASANAAAAGEEVLTNAGMLARARALGFTSPMAGGLKAFGGRVGMGLGLAVGGQVLAKGNELVGGPSDLSGALAGAGTGAGIGSMFGTPGAVVGGVLGGAYGALKGPLADKKAVELYDKQVDAYLAARKELPKGMRGDAKKAALAIHNNDAIPLTQKPAALAALVQQMGAATQQKKALGGGDLTKRALQVQLEMTNMMNNIGNQAVGSGDAMAASIRAGIPNASPELQPLLERDAADRAAFGRTLQTAYTGATYAQPQIAKMDAQLALLRQLQQQMAAQSSGGSSSTIAGQLAALK